MSVEGLVTQPSLDGFDTTVARLDAALAARCISPLLRLDHSAAAAGAGLSLSPVILFLFGNPAVGTKLMQMDPTAGIDLPLKLLIWEDRSGSILVGYNDPAWIRARHNLPQSETLGTMGRILCDLAALASGRDRP